MELKIGDLVQHSSNKQYGIVIGNPHRWRDCVVCEVQWCFLDRKHLIDVDFLDRINKT
tara:strand:- start:203 stop:376 length:174 start_codon:yes stop_codon:yes gene_type:complete